MAINENSTSASQPAVRATNTGAGAAVSAETNANAPGAGVGDMVTPAIDGRNQIGGTGVEGYSSGGTSKQSFGILGRTDGLNELGAAGVKGDGGDKATGVLGFARGVDQTGVVGTSNKGVGGKFSGITGAVCEGGKEAGIRATSTDRWGGEFSSEKRAQIRLVPREVEFSGEGDPLPTLPLTGNKGEVLAILNQNEECSLWLCVKGVTMTTGEPSFPMPATWAELQLGRMVSGQI